MGRGHPVNHSPKEKWLSFPQPPLADNRSSSVTVWSPWKESQEERLMDRKGSAQTEAERMTSIFHYRTKLKWLILVIHHLSWTGAWGVAKDTAAIHWIPVSLTQVLRRQDRLHNGLPCVSLLAHNLCYKGHLLALKVNIVFPLIPSQNPGYAWETHSHNWSI